MRCAVVMMLVVVMLVVMVVVTAAEFAMEGEEFSLQCTADGRVQYWMLHGAGTAYQVGQTYEQDSIRVDQDGTLHFKVVVTSHEGSHLCVYTHSLRGTTAGVQVNMSVRARPSAHPWEDMYKSQFITGLLAAVVCALLFTAGCLVFRFRYREPKQVLLEESGHYNPALDVEGDPEGASTKM